MTLYDGKCHSRFMQCQIVCLPLGRLLVKQPEEKQVWMQQSLGVTKEKAMAAKVR